MAALMVPTAAYPDFGNSAELPDISTTDPRFFFSVSHALMVSRRAPWSFNSIPAFHCASVISSTSIWGTAPAMLRSASMRPNRSSVLPTTVSGGSTLLMSRSSTRGSAPRALTSLAVLSSFAPLRATSTTPEKSCASRMAVARPIPWLAPVTIATVFFMMASSSFSAGVGLGLLGLGQQIGQFVEKRGEEDHDRQHQKPRQQRRVQPVPKEHASRGAGAGDRGRDGAGDRGLHDGEQEMGMAPWNPEHR